MTEWPLHVFSFHIIRIATLPSMLDWAGKLRIQGMTNMGMCICQMWFSVPRLPCVMHGAPAYVLERLVIRFPDLPPNSLTTFRYSAPRYFRLVLFHQTTNQSIFPMNPSMPPCQYSPKCFHLSCLPVYTSSIANELTYTSPSNWIRLCELELEISTYCYYCIPE